MANTYSLAIQKASNQYVTTPDVSDLNFGGAPFSVEIWFKRASFGVNMGLISKIDGLDNTGWRMAFDTNDNLGFACINGHSADSVATTTPIKDTNWHQASFERNGSNLLLFIDTVQVANALDNARNVSNTNVLAIGPFRSGDLGSSSLAFDGEVDEVRLWNTNISQNGSIIPNSTRELAGNEPNLVAYYKLNNSYVDQTGNGHTLTPSGLPTFTTDVPFTDSTTTSTSTTSTSSSTSTTSTSSSTSTTTSTSSSTSTTSTSTTSTRTTTSTTTTSTSTTSTSSSTTTTSTSTSTTTSTSTSTTMTIDLRLIVEKVK